MDYVFMKNGGGGGTLRQRMDYADNQATMWLTRSDYVFHSIRETLSAVRSEVAEEEVQLPIARPAGS